MLPNMVSSTLARSGPLPPVRASAPRAGREAPAASLFGRRERNMPKYTGHVPGLMSTFGITYGTASETMLDAVRHRDGALQRGSAGDSTLPDPGCEPALQTHLQGSEVDTVGYYETLIRTDYQGLRVKTSWDPLRQGPPSVKVGNGSPHRNYSAICLGDRFYFNGAHMFQTTTAETSQGGLDKTKAGRLPPQQVELTSLRLGGCTKLVRSPRTRSPQGHFGFAE